MANDGKFLNLSSGTTTQESAINVSTGAPDAGKIPKLDASGTLPLSMLPAGVGAEVLTVTTSEALAAGDFVNLWNSTGLKARKADAITAGKEAHGFVIAAFGSATSATVYLPSQVNTGVTGKTVGAKQFLGTTAGQSTETAPSATGNVVQQLGVAYSATGILFQPLAAITVA